VTQVFPLWHQKNYVAYQKNSLPRACISFGHNMKFFWKITDFCGLHRFPSSNWILLTWPKATLAFTKRNTLHFQRQLWSEINISLP
jgi:hypothetical protein